MKKNELDVSQGFSSDCLLNALSSLYDHLSIIFGGWLYHGKVRRKILVCAFIPLLKAVKKIQQHLKVTEALRDLH